MHVPRTSGGAPSPPSLTPNPLHVLAMAVLMAVFLKTCMHQIPEGHVGVYWRGGKLLKRITGPGIHSRLPLLDSFEAIQVTMQTDLVRDIMCGTKGGVTISFEKVEVVNRLQKALVYETIRDYGIHYDKTWIFEKVHHEVNQFCSSHSLQEVYIDMFNQVDERIKEALQADCNRYAPGIEIISVRVTKPTIPPSIMANYVAMEEERTKVLVVTERQRVVEKEVEAERLRAIAQAEQQAHTSRILMGQRLAEAQAAQAQEAIQNAILLARLKVQTDADAYRWEREAATNQLRLTPEFLQLAFIQAIANNTKLFFGEKVPSMLDVRWLAGDARPDKSGSRDIGADGVGITEDKE